MMDKAQERQDFAREHFKDEAALTQLYEAETRRDAKAFLFHVDVACKS